MFLLVVGAWLVKGTQGCDDNILEDVIMFLWLFKAFSEEVGRRWVEFSKFFRRSWSDGGRIFPNFLFAHGCCDSPRYATGDNQNGSA